MPPKKKQPGRGGKRVGAGAPRGPRQSTIEKQRAQLVEHRVAQVIAKNDAAAPASPPAEPRQVRSDSVSQPARRKAVDLLEEMMFLLYGLSAHYQPKPNEVEATTPQNRRLFNYYSKRFVDTAARLAPYQSATFKAHAMVPSPLPMPAETARPKGGNIIDLTDQRAVAQHYRRVMMKRTA